MTATIVIGPPCAGKTTHAWSNRGETDLIVDYDRIATALGHGATHGVDGTLRTATLAARAGAIAVALESDEPTWIIHTSPSASQMGRYADAGAEFVLLDPGEDECLDRARSEFRPEGTEDVIRAWYADPPAIPASPSARHRAAPAQNGATMSGNANPFGIPQAFHASKPEWIQIEKVQNVAGQKSTATVHLYDAIDPWWGISAQSFVDEIRDLDVEEIVLRVNSPGGSVYDGIAITNALRAHSAKVVAYVDGIAASIASVIITAADEVVMMPNSEIMIHEPWGYGMGDARDLSKTAGRLDQIAVNIAGAYADRAGGKAEDWRDAMLAETWYSAAEAVTAGLADRAESAARHEDEPADVENRFDLTVYAHAGRSEAPDPRMPANAAATRKAPTPADIAKATKNSHTSLDVRATRSAEPDTHNTERKESPRMADYTPEVRNRLGLPAEGDIDDATFVAALERSMTPQNTQATAPGTVVLDEEQHRALLEGAEAGRLAREEQNAARRTALVNAAIDEGRIAPARREHWLNALEADEEGMTPVLTNLAKGLVPLEAKGKTGGIAEATSHQDDDLFNTLWPAQPATDTTSKEA